MNDVIIQCKIHLNFILFVWFEIQFGGGAVSQQNNAYLNGEMTIKNYFQTLFSLSFVFF